MHRFSIRQCLSSSIVFAAIAFASLDELQAQQKGSNPELAPVASRMKEFVDQGELAGAVTLVAKNGKIVHLNAVGWEDREKKQPMRPESLFSIASMTKPITAVAALMLVEQGKLSLDEPIAKRLKEFGTDRGRTITLRHLLTHTSGLVGNQQNVGSLAETAIEIAGRPIAFSPGKAWAYSPGISVTGRLVEVASGETLEQFLSKNIFTPLKMIDTTYHPNPEQLSRLAQLYKGKNLERADNWFLGPLENRSPNPSGGLYSTANDLFRFYQMLLNGGEIDGARILSKETVTEMTRPQTGQLKAGFVPGSVWGLGVGIVQEPTGVTSTLSTGSFGHGGLYGTQAWADPKKNAIYILLIQKIGIVNSDASPYRKAFQELAGKEINE
jgi:CubicO group peptidase (beta-lactamase class C family)